MNNKGKQPHSLAVSKGALTNPQQAESDGLLDCIKLRSVPKSVYYQMDFLACIDQNGNPFIFYHQKNRYINIAVPSPAIQLVYIDNKGGQLVVALQNRTIQINSCMNGKTLKTLKGHEHKILNLHVNHRQNLLLAVSQEVCALYNLDSFDRVQSLFSKGSIFINACFLPSSTEIGTIFADRTLSIWNINSFEVISRVQLPEQQIKQAQILPTLDSNNLLIHCYGNKVYQIDQNNIIFHQTINSGYGNGINQIKSLKKGSIFILTKNNMLIQIDKNGTVQKNIELPNRTPINFDIIDNKIAIVLNTGELLIYDLNKVPNLKFDSLLGNNTSSLINENYPDNTDTMNFNNNTTQINIKRVSENKENVFQASQSTVIKKNSRSISQNQYTLAKNYKNNTNPLRDILNYSKLESFIKQFKIFPTDKRSLAWRSLLNLPMNQEAYNNLLSQGIHPAYAQLADQYPLKSESLFSRLQRTLSALAYYCPLFAEVDYLPQLVFPFVKLFKRGEELLIFEVTLSILVHFCQHFFENFPKASVSVMHAHDQAFQIADPELFNHMKDVLQYECVKNAWPLLKQFYTNLFNEEQWTQIMDFLVLHNDYSQCLLLLSVQYFRYFRLTILRMNEPEFIKQFMHHSNGQATINTNQILSQ